MAESRATYYHQELRRAEAAWPLLSLTQAAIRGLRPSIEGRSIITIGSGCSAPVAKLAEVASLASGSKLAQTCTPFQVISSGLEPDLAIIISAKGSHPDIVECFNTLQRRRVAMVVVTLGQPSPLVSLAEQADVATQIVTPDPPAECGGDGFIPVIPPLLLALLLPAVLGLSTGPDTAPDLFTRAREDHRNLLEESGPEWKRHITVLCTQWALPGAWDLETRMMESGIAPPAICDPWNFAHGRYMPVAAGSSGIVMMTVPGDCGDLERVRKHLPASAVLADIIAPVSGFWGGIYCIIRSMLLAAHLSSLYGIDPARPSVPEWGDALYNRGIE